MIDILWHIFLGLSIGALIFGFFWSLNYFVNLAIPLSCEEIAAREAERAAKKAAKEFRRRKRLGVVRFWNF